MNNKLILYVILLCFSFSSCYDDLGNYDYDTTINDVTVKMNRVYGVRKVDTTFVIRPEIMQTNRTDNSNLRYAWTVNTDSDQRRGDTLSFGDTLAFVIDPVAQNFQYTYYIRFYITDMVTGGKQMIPATLNITKPYEGAWMILHREDGITKLGSVEYIGEDIVINDDAYFTERGEHLKGEPGSLGLKTTPPTASYWGYSATSVLYCFTSNPEESGILRQDNHFELYGNMQKCIFPNHYAEFNTMDASVKGEDGGPIAISNGRVFQGSSYGPRMYGMFPAGEVAGDYKITHRACGPHVQLVYDAIGHRFLSCYAGANYYYMSRWVFAPEAEYQAKMELVPKDPGSVAGVDLDNIGDDKEMVFMGEGYWYGQAALIAAWQRFSLYAFAKSKSTNKSYVYEFHAYPLVSRTDLDDRAPLTGLFTINTPAGVTTETQMASSFEYNRLLFYVVENRIYRLDFGAVGGTTTLIYQHPGALKPTKMRMAREGNQGNNFPAYGHPVSRSLGIAFEMEDGTNEFVVLNLTSAGKIAENGKYSSIQIHKGFGKIKDIVFI